MTWSTGLSLSIRVPRYGCDVTTVNLLGKELRGSLSPALCEFPKLQHLILSGTELSGDLAMLAKCKELNELSLLGTSVAGDLKALREMEKLKVLDLRDTRVYGEVEAVKNASELKHLDLSETNATGALPHLPSLRSLYIARTNVYGHLNGLLQNAFFLVNLDLSHTKVSGSLSAVKEAVTSKKMVKLDLSHTKVTGDVASLQSALDHATILKYLDISGIPIEGDISGSNLHSGSLETFKAAGCGLQGSLTRRFFQFSAVVTLDLASNKITYVDYIPIKCRTLILASETTIDFAPGILRKAVEHYVFVDLRNVTLKDKTEAWPHCTCRSCLH